jgi:hypothetical protein
MSSVGNPRRNARKRVSSPTRRRALELLADSPNGATEAILVARGLSIDLLVELVRAGLATAKAARVMAGGRSMQVTHVRNLLLATCVYRELPRISSTRC